MKKALLLILGLLAATAAFGQGINTTATVSPSPVSGWTPTDTPGMSIPFNYFLHAKDWSTPSGTSNCPNCKLPSPLVARTNAGERPWEIETARGTFSSTLGNLYEADANGWIPQAQAYKATVLYTSVALPHWMSSSTATGTTPTLISAPYDINTANESCIAIGSNPAFTSATGDCLYKEFWHGFLQKVCHVTSTPSTPLTGKCDVKYYEGWNEFNSNGFWTDSYTNLAKMMVDESLIVRAYCGDCKFILGSTSGGGSGYNPAGGSGNFDTALGALLDAAHSYATTTLGLSSWTPDAVSFHAYPGHDTLSPMVMPEKMYSTAQSTCTSTNTPNSTCEWALKDEGSMVRAQITSRSWLNANLPIWDTETGFYLNSDIQVDSTTATINGVSETQPGPNSWMLRQAWVARTMLWEADIANSSTAAHFWYQEDNDCDSALVGFGDGAGNSNGNFGGCPSGTDVLPAQLLPTGVAWNTVYGWLHGSSFQGAITNPSGDIYTVNITRPDGSTAQIIWNWNWLQTESYATTYTTYQDINAGTHTVSSGTVTISNTPILLYGTAAVSNPTTGLTYVSNFPPPSTLTSVMPVWSDKFADSIGVNTHWLYTNTEYGWHTEQVVRLLQSAGIRHTRDGFACSWDGGNIPENYLMLHNQLAAIGIHTDYVAAYSGCSQANIVDVLTSLGDADALEGPNECDAGGNCGGGGTTGAVNGADAMPMIFAAGQQLGIPVIGQSFTTSQGISAVGNQLANINYNNIHIYYGGRTPETQGWGPADPNGRNSQGLGWWYDLQQSFSGATSPYSPGYGVGDQAIVTETGYLHTMHEPYTIDQSTLAAYVPRLFLQHFLVGIPRTYYYEFYDEGIGPITTGSSNNAAGYGLIRVDGSPTPGYHAIANLIALSSDKQPGVFSPSVPLTYSVTGTTTNVQSLVLQKASGVYYLVLWINDGLYNEASNTDSANTIQTVTVNVSGNPNIWKSFHMTATGSFDQTIYPSSPQSITLSVDDYPTFIRIQ
jgi:hypothetical protein